jgi:hypothetical protein
MKNINTTKIFCVFFLCFMASNVSAEDCAILEKQVDMNCCYMSEYTALDNRGR